MNLNSVRFSLLILMKIAKNCKITKPAQIISVAINCPAKKIAQNMQLNMKFQRTQATTVAQNIRVSQTSQASKVAQTRKFNLRQTITTFKMPTTLLLRYESKTKVRPMGESLLGYLKT